MAKLPDNRNTFLTHKPPCNYRRCVRPAWVLYRKIQRDTRGCHIVIPTGQVPCRQVGISLLASDKVVNREVRTEGSQTAKAGTDPVLQRGRLNRNDILRLVRMSKQAHLCKALDQQIFISRCRRFQPKVSAITWGDLEPHELRIEKSAEVILVNGIRVDTFGIKSEFSRVDEGLNPVSSTGQAVE